MDFFGLQLGSQVQSALLHVEDLSKGGENFWNVPRPTGVFLNMMVRFLDARNVLEIGTSNGYSGIFLAEALSHTGGKLYTVESHKERFSMAREHFCMAGLERYIEQIKGHAPEAVAQRFDKSFGEPFVDLVFIDATKMEYKGYLEVVKQMVRAGGMIIADNCLSHAEDTEPFVEAVSADDALENLLLPLDQGLMLARKRSE